MNISYLSISEAMDAIEQFVQDGFVSFSLERSGGLWRVGVRTKVLFVQAPLGLKA